MLDIADLSTPLIGPVELHVPRGACIGLMGPSGAGKSLLLRAISDLDPNQGLVRLDGRDRAGIAAPDWRRQVALVPAESGWWGAHVGAHFARSPDPKPDLEALGLGDALNWEVARLSSGEKQRLALVRALQLGPAVLLLDEPTASLDAEATKAVEAVLRARMRGGLTILLVTHDAAQAGRMCSPTYRLLNGRVEGQA